MSTVTMHVGSNLDVLPTLAENSIDAIVTDPPYELGFMGKAWDASGIAYNVELWRQCLRVLKPGGHLLAFSGSRTYHRMTCAIEDAGFEVRDQIMWVYGSGFPKSLNVGKKIEGWDGWGTALKPAHEPICVARKPLDGTVADNVMKWGTGAINVDGCRVGFVSEEDKKESTSKNQHESFGTPPMTGNVAYGDYSMVQPKNYNPPGRWPANLIHDGSNEVLELFPESKSTGGVNGGGLGKNVFGKYSNNAPNANAGGLGDSGSAARFFYCPKASKRDRDDGCEGMEERRESDREKDDGVGGDNPRNRTNEARRNFHPTVKPTELMRYLCRLVTPPGGTVLDPFMGSGSTGRGAVLEGFAFTGIELSDEYAVIARARIDAALKSRQTPT